MNINTKKLITFSGIIFLILLIDRITKNLALVLTHPKIINSSLSFDLVFNRGINWGLFNSDNNVQFMIINVLIAIVIVSMMIYTWLCYKQRYSIVGNLFILAGAFSNYYDRIVYGGVIDFIVLSMQAWSWPAFNIADVAIVSGVALVIYEQLINK